MNFGLWVDFPMQNQCKRHNASEIHCGLCEVYRPTVVSISKVRQWCHEFNDVYTNIHFEGPTCIGGESSNVQMTLLNKWTQVQFIVFPSIVSAKLGYHKQCKMGPKNGDWRTQKSVNGTACAFLDHYGRGGGERQTDRGTHTHMDFNINVK